MNYVTECPHPLKTTDTRILPRLTTPSVGDVVDFTLLGGKYPFLQRRYGLISDISADGVARVCVEVIGAFVSLTNAGDVHLSVSGGPWVGVPIKAMHPMHQAPYQHCVKLPPTQEVTLWNWGTGKPGAGNAIRYKVDRPVFLATGFKGQYQSAEVSWWEGCHIPREDFDSILEHLGDVEVVNLPSAE